MAIPRIVLSALRAGRPLACNCQEYHGFRQVLMDFTSQQRQAGYFSVASVAEYEQKRLDFLCSGSQETRTSVL